MAQQYVTSTGYVLRSQQITLSDFIHVGRLLFFLVVMMLLHFPLPLLEPVSFTTRYGLLKYARCSRVETYPFFGFSRVTCGAGKEVYYSFLSFWGSVVAEGDPPEIFNGTPVFSFNDAVRGVDSYLFLNRPTSFLFLILFPFANYLISKLFVTKRGRNWLEQHLFAITTTTISDALKPWKLVCTNFYSSSIIPLFFDSIFLDNLLRLSPTRRIPDFGAGELDHNQNLILFTLLSVILALTVFIITSRNPTTFFGGPSALIGALFGNLIFESEIENQRNIAMSLPYTNVNVTPTIMFVVCLAIDHFYTCRHNTRLKIIAAAAAFALRLKQDN